MKATQLRRGLIATLMSIPLLLGGCANPEKLIQKNESYNATGGYITGIFYGVCQEYGFGIVNTETGRAYFMSFFEPEPSLRGAIGGNMKDRPEHVSLIAVPPGKYKIAYWAIFNSTLNSLDKKIDTKNPNEFEVLPGRATVLGRFEVTQRRATSYTIELAINLRPISKTRFKELFSSEFQYIPTEALFF